MQRNCGAASVGILQENLALALRRSESNDGLTLETSASESPLRWPIHIINPAVDNKTKLSCPKVTKFIRGNTVLNTENICVKIINVMGVTF